MKCMRFKRIPKSILRSFLSIYSLLAILNSSFFKNAKDALDFYEMFTNS